jgi:hypothetical protein
VRRRRSPSRLRPRHLRQLPRRPALLAFPSASTTDAPPLGCQGQYRAAMYAGTPRSSSPARRGPPTQRRPRRLRQQPRVSAGMRAVRPTGGRRLAGCSADRAGRAPLRRDGTSCPTVKSSGVQRVIRGLWTIPISYPRPRSARAVARQPGRWRSRRRDPPPAAPARPRSLNACRVHAPTLTVATRTSMPNRRTKPRSVTRLTFHRARIGCV